VYELVATSDNLHVATACMADKFKKKKKMMCAEVEMKLIQMCENKK